MSWRGVSAKHNSLICGRIHRNFYVNTTRQKSSQKRAIILRHTNVISQKILVSNKNVVTFEALLVSEQQRFDDPYKLWDQQ